MATELIRTTVGHDGQSDTISHEVIGTFREAFVAAVCAEALATRTADCFYHVAFGPPSLDERPRRWHPADGIHVSGPPEPEPPYTHVMGGAASVGPAQSTDTTARTPERYALSMLYVRSETESSKNCTTAADRAWRAAWVEVRNKCKDALGISANEAAGA